PVPSASRTLWWSVGLLMVALVGAVGWNWNGNRLGEEMINLVRGDPPAGRVSAAPSNAQPVEGDDAAARALAAAERARLALGARTTAATVPTPAGKAALPAPQAGDVPASTQDVSPAPAEKAPLQPATDPSSEGPATVPVESTAGENPSPPAA